MSKNFWMFHITEIVMIVCLLFMMGKMGFEVLTTGQCEQQIFVTTGMMALLCILFIPLLEWKKRSAIDEDLDSYIKSDDDEKEADKQ